MNRVKQIHDLGQSIWLDFFDRKIMNTGELTKLIQEDGVSGVTSNPSIFEKAIRGSEDYDEDIRSLSSHITDNGELFFKMAVKDIQRATDLFSPVFKEADGQDGFVSLEVSPHLARETEKTIQQAMDLFSEVDRKNVMIKIPGTKEGLPAIRKCISEGLNINITLLFGLPRYREVTDAYLSGLEDRIKAGKSIENIASVASFFLSRIDVMVDPMLEAAGKPDLKGMAAIASAKEAYAIFQEVFNSGRFNKLKEKGAKVQKVLWASTSTKDPVYSDVKYVEALIGPQTIDTIPIETLEAFRDHGQARSTLEQNRDEAQKVLAGLKEAGINIDDVTQQLEEEGIDKFNKAYDQLLDAIDKQRKKS